MIEFQVIRHKEIQKGEVIYVDSEKSFDFKPLLNSDISIVFGYLNLGIDSETMQAQQVWGFSPKESWQYKNIEVPKHIKGNLKLVGEYEPGLSWRVDTNKPWKSYFDNKSGWYCIGSYNLDNECVCVEFCTDTIAIMNKSILQAILLKPNFK